MGGSLLPTQQAVINADLPSVPSNPFLAGFSCRFKKMLGLVLYTLFVGLISDYTLVAARVTLDFIGTGNALTLQCKGSDGLVDRRAIFDFYDAMDSPTSNHGSGENGLQFNITPTTEAIVTCRIGEDHSPAYAFAAIPTMLTNNRMEAITENTYVFSDEPSRRLTCPARLGILHTRLDPYSMSWRKVDMNGGTTVIITSPITLSSDKRELTIPITNSTDMEMYQCTLRLRRCNLTDNRCNIQTYYGPLMKLIVLERSTSTPGVGPQYQRELFGDIARFDCSASGTNIRIRWEILGITYEVNTTAAGITISETRNGLNSLNSIIEIRTAEINLTEVTLIRCTIYQELPHEAIEQGLSAREYSFLADLTLMPIITTSTTPVTMTPPVTPVSTIGNTTPVTMTPPVTPVSTIGNNIVNKSNNSAVIGGAIGIIIAILVTVIAIVLLIFCVFMWKRKHNNIIELNFIEDPREKDNVRQLKQMSVQSSFKRNIPQQLIIHSCDLDLGKAIGQGEFGIVYKSQLKTSHRDTNSDIVAVKTLKGFIQNELVRDLLKECVKMHELDHPNVLRLIGVCLDGGPAPYIVMPFMENGSLLSHLKAERESIVLDPDCSNLDDINPLKKKLMDMCLQVAKGMEYLASKRIIHRDLAARNCMIDVNFVIKVADFGLAESIDPTKEYFRQDENVIIKLPVKWLALESINDGVFSEKSDVWAYGVTCWEIFSGGRTPYPGISPMDLPYQLMSGLRMNKPLNAACSADIYSLMIDCLRKKSELRPSFAELVTVLSSKLAVIAEYIDLSSHRIVQNVQVEDEFKRVLSSDYTFSLNFQYSVV